MKILDENNPFLRALAARQVCRQLSTSEVALFRDCISRLNQLGEGEYGPVQESGEQWVIDCAAACFVVVTNVWHSSQPSPCAICASVKHGKAWIPGFQTKDFIESCNALEIRAVEDKVQLFEFATQSFGLCKRNQPSVRIKSAQDAASVGILCDDGLITTGEYLPGGGTKVAISEFQSDEKSLWWQKWGGLLFTFCVDEKAGSICKLLEAGVGRMEHIKE
jgi:hypothetical protein